MKRLLSLLLLSVIASPGNAAPTATDSLPHTVKPSTNKGEKWYCSDIAKTRYKLVVTGSKIKITRFYKEFTDSYSGTIKNGKIYSNDPNEKSLKDVWGRYYKLEGKNFGVLNIENGDYEWFAECKR
ncbi:MAG: hypothetical protein ACXVBZ_14265 [Flavisolibacter sp.]